MDAANVVRSARLSHLPTERVSDSYARRLNAKRDLVEAYAWLQFALQSGLARSYRSPRSPALHRPRGGPVRVTVGK
jgi:hypothetical protein